MTDDPISERDGPTLEEMHGDLDRWRKSLPSEPRSCHHYAHRTCVQPTRRQLEVLMAYLLVGGEKEAAHDLGISIQTLKNHLSSLYRLVGTVNAAQTSYLFGAGYLTGGERL